jgi:hypothetical protein
MVDGVEEVLWLGFRCTMMTLRVSQYESAAQTEARDRREGRQWSQLKI